MAASEGSVASAEVRRIPGCAAAIGLRPGATDQLTVRPGLPTLACHGLSRSAKAGFIQGDEVLVGIETGHRVFGVWWWPFAS